MPYDIDPNVRDKVKEKYPDDKKQQARIETELSKYPPNAQRSWVANPIVEYILQGYIASLQGRAGGAVQTIRTSDVSASPDSVKKDVATDDDDANEEEPSMFNLFD